MVLTSTERLQDVLMKHILPEITVTPSQGHAQVHRGTLEHCSHVVTPVVQPLGHPRCNNSLLLCRGTMTVVKGDRRGDEMGRTKNDKSGKTSILVLKHSYDTKIFFIPVLSPFRIMSLKWR